MSHFPYGIRPVHTLAPLSAERLRSSAATAGESLNSDKPGYGRRRRAATGSLAHSQRSDADYRLTSANASSGESSRAVSNSTSKHMSETHDCRSAGRSGKVSGLSGLAIALYGY